MVLPSSHCSLEARLPSPQNAEHESAEFGESLVQIKPNSTVHVAEHPSSVHGLPSSHASGGHRRPSPHFSIWQDALHPSQLAVFPSSHCSPGSTKPLPQAASTSHSAEQPSPSTRLPSSHSSGDSRTPSPQTASLVQVAEHPSPPTVFPSSHASPASCLPLPQKGPQLNEHTPVTQHSQSVDNVPQQGCVPQPRGAARCMSKTKAEQKQAQITWLNTHCSLNFSQFVEHLFARAKIAFTRRIVAADVRVAAVDTAKVGASRRLRCRLRANTASNSATDARGRGAIACTSCTTHADPENTERLPQTDAGRGRRHMR